VSLQEQALRMLRDDWTAKMLSEELYAIFRQEIPLNTTATNNMTAPDAGPALNLRQYGDGPVLQIYGKKNEPAGGLYVQDGKLLVQPSGKLKPGVPPSPPSAGGAFPGQVQSGAGSSYIINGYKHGSGGAATGAVSARVPGLAAGEVVPAGTWVTVCDLGNGVYEAVVPLWQ
jgi:hypothetical protein